MLSLKSGCHNECSQQPGLVESAWISLPSILALVLMLRSDASGLCLSRLLVRQPSHERTKLFCEADSDTLILANPLCGSL